MADHHRTRTVRSLAVLAGTFLLLAGCTTEQDPPPIADPSEDEGMLADEDPLADPATDSEESPAATPGASPTEAGPIVPTIEVPTLDVQCTVEPSAPQVEQVTYSVPGSWQVGDSCQFLDPEPGERAEEGTEGDADILVTADEAAYGDVMEPDPALEDVTTWLGARAGYQAARRTGTGTGEGLTPEGAPVLTWVHDLDAGTDEDGGALTISTSADDQQVRAVVDAIAQTVVIQPPADVQAENSAPESLAIVRVEGGGTPFAVTYDGDCFALRPGGPEEGRSDQECGLDPTTGPIVARVLGDEIVVGYAPATSIAVQSEELAPPYGLTLNIEGGSVFAFPIDELPQELTAIGPAGEELVTVPVQ